jgi:hypothetical protein
MKYWVCENPNARPEISLPVANRMVEVRAGVWYVIKIDLETEPKGLSVNGLLYGTEEYGCESGRFARSPHLVARYPSTV